jgi:hypothetical protein
LQAALLDAPVLGDFAKPLHYNARELIDARDCSHWVALVDVRWIVIKECREPDLIVRPQPVLPREMKEPVAVQAVNEDLLLRRRQHCHCRTLHLAAEPGDAVTAPWDGWQVCEG